MKIMIIEIEIMIIMNNNGINNIINDNDEMCINDNENNEIINDNNINDNEILMIIMKMIVNNDINNINNDNNSNDNINDNN